MVDHQRRGRRGSETTAASPQDLQGTWKGGRKAGKGRRGAPELERPSTVYLGISIPLSALRT